MEFGFEPVCDQVRAGSSYLDKTNLLEPGRRSVRSWSKPNSILLARLKLVWSWFGACSELVRSWFELKFGLSSSLLAAN